MDADHSSNHRSEPTRDGTVEPANRAAVAKERFQAPHPKPLERFELRDPFLGVTDRANIFNEISAKAEQLGASRVTALDADGARTLAQHYLVTRAPVMVGDRKSGNAEYRLRGDSSRVAFTESTFRLATGTTSPSVARSMVDLAQARDWTGLRVSGAEDFRQRVWLEASVRGVRAVGYEPKPADRELLWREREARQIRRLEPARDVDNGGDTAAGVEKASFRGGGRKAVVAAIDAVLIARKVPEEKRQAVLAAATAQLTRMAQRGDAAPKIRIFDRTAPQQVPVTAPRVDLHLGQDSAAPTRSR